MRGPSARTFIGDKLHLGHSQGLMLVDAQFPGNIYEKWVLQADDLKIPDRLDTPSCPLFCIGQG
jgi:L-fucose mutarotase/ribose pyranase (RbsD/FucU family)